MRAAVAYDSERACYQCGTRIAAGLSRCPQCGRLEGQKQRCPDCQVEVDLVRSQALRFVCAICGRARVPLDDPTVERSFAELDDLRRAGRARMARLVWRLSAAMMAGSALLALVTTAALAIIFDLAAFALLLLALAVALPLALATFFGFRVKRSTARLDEALDDAWLKVATELARARPVMDAMAIASAMRLDEVAATKLAAKVSVREILSEAPDAERWLRLERELEGRARLDDSVTELSEPRQEDDAFQTKRQRT